jgi:hypothetical protein
MTDKPLPTDNGLGGGSEREMAGDAEGGGISVIRECVEGGRGNI